MSLIGPAEDGSAKGSVNEVIDPTQILQRSSSVLLVDWPHTGSADYQEK